MLVSRIPVAMIPGNAYRMAKALNESLTKRDDAWGYEADEEVLATEDTEITEKVTKKESSFFKPL
jgi:uncharacterized protein YtpQ (UPF0354 family)